MFIPKTAKMELAKSIVAMYHNEEIANNAATEFDKVFKENISFQAICLK